MHIKINRPQDRREPFRDIEPRHADRWSRLLVALYWIARLRAIMVYWDAGDDAGGILRHGHSQLHDCRAGVSAIQRRAESRRKGHRFVPDSLEPLSKQATDSSVFPRESDHDLKTGGSHQATLRMRQRLGASRACAAPEKQSHDSGIDYGVQTAELRLVYCLFLEH